jgi:zinc protease
VDGEFQRAESDPGFQLWMDVNKRTWNELFTRKNAIGDHDVINTATPEKMLVIKDKYYHPNNSLLVICGDINAQEAFAGAEKIFGDWAHSGYDPHVKYPIPEFPPIQQTDYNILVSSIAQTPYIMYQWQGPDHRNDSAATVAADVFSTIMGMNSSKWQQALIDKGLATYAGVSYQTCKYVGPIQVFVVPNPARLKECIDEVKKQLNLWANEEYFSDDQLQTAKDILRRNYIRNSEKPSTLSMQLTYHWCSTSLDYFTAYPEDLQQVTRDDIREYIKKYITGKPFIAGMIINDAMSKQFKPETYFKN